MSDNTHSSEAVAGLWAPKTKHFGLSDQTPFTPERKTLLRGDNQPASPDSLSGTPSSMLLSPAAAHLTPRVGSPTVTSSPESIELDNINRNNNSRNQSANGQHATNVHNQTNNTGNRDLEAANAAAVRASRRFGLFQLNPKGSVFKRRPIATVSPRTQKIAAIAGLALMLGVLVFIAFLLGSFAAAAFKDENKYVHEQE